MCRTSVKAAVVLQPLLGITNILQIVSNPYDVKIISEYTKNLTGGVHNLFIYENHVYALSNSERYYISRYLLTRT